MSITKLALLCHGKKTSVEKERNFYREEKVYDFQRTLLMPSRIKK